MDDDVPVGDTGKRTNLGRGLAALFGEESDDYASLDKVRAAKPVPIEHLHPNRFQPRQDFPADSLRALSESIAANGILQPILVRRHAERPSEFEIVAGERRWRAAQMAKIHEIPVVIREFTDAQALEAAIVENVQRQDLSPIEEAQGYQRLIDELLVAGIGIDRYFTYIVTRAMKNVPQTPVGLAVAALNDAPAHRPGKSSGSRR